MDRVSELSLVTYQLFRKMSCCEADGILWRIEVIYCEFVAMDALWVFGCGPGVTILQCLAEAHVRMGRVVEELLLSNWESSNVRAPLVLDGTVGRPKFDMQRCQLEFLHTKEADDWLQFQHT